MNRLVEANGGRTTAERRQSRREWAALTARILRYIHDNPEAMAEYRRRHVKQLVTDYGTINYIEHPLFTDTPFELNLTPHE